MHVFSVFVLEVNRPVVYIKRSSYSADWRERAPNPSSLSSDYS